MTLDDVREQNRNRQRVYRERKKLLEMEGSKTKLDIVDKECNVTYSKSLRKHDFLCLTKSPFIIIGLVYILALTIILIILQTQAYNNVGQNLALPIAMACELGLVILAAIRFTGWHRFCSVTVTLLLFFYNLGLMGFDIVQAEETKTATSLEENSRVKSLNSDISLAQAAQKLAIKKEESGNIKYHSARIAELRAELKNLTPEIISASHTQAKSWGLVALRAILMLLNTLLVHGLADYARKRSLDKDLHRVALT